MKDRVGEQWGNYRLIQFLGRGGFAEVYLGQHLRLTGQRAALKILATHLSEEDIERFHNEAETIVSLIHPHIVRVLDFALNEGVPFLVMDYAPGGSLRRRHPRGQQVELNRVVAYVQQIAEGLQYAHDRKIIHRDIKPDNMLIGTRDEILLSDFGIATIAHGTSSQSAQLAIGTIPYMAPEQIQEHPRQASDQYALAVTVYEWLAGRLPFAGTFTEVAAKHMLTAPPPLRGSVPALPSEVEQVILTALAKDPRARFGSVQAFARALVAASSEGYKTVIMPSPPPAPEPKDRTILSGPDTGSTFVAYPPVVPASDAATFINTPDRGWATPQPVPAPGVPTPIVPVTPRMFDATQPPVTPVSPPVQPYVPVAPTPAVQPYAPMLVPPPVSAPAPSPAPVNQNKVSRRVVVAGLIGVGVVAVGGGAIALIASESHSKQPLTASTPTHTAKPTPTPTPVLFAGKPLLTYSGHHGALRSLDWSPNSKLIVSGAEDKTVHIWDPATGKTTFVYTKHPAELLSVAWSPDGALIASSGRGSSAQVWDSSTGAQITNYTGHTDDVHGIALSLDSKHVVTGSDDHSVQIWEARTGNLISKYTGHHEPLESVQWSPVDANLVVTACDDQTVQILNVSTPTATLVQDFKGHTNWVLSARWSPDGKFIASAGRDRTVRVWNVSTGTLLFTDTSHPGIVEKVDWSPDGKLLASVGDDKTVQVLEVSTRKLIFNQKMDNFMYALAWSPNGKFIAIGGADKTAQIWSASS